MLIRVQDIDPQVFQSFMEEAQASYQKPDPPADLRRVQQEDRRRFRPNFRPVLPWAIAGAILWPAGAALAAAMGVPWDLAAAALSHALWVLPAAGLLAVFWRTVKGASVLHSDLLAGVLPHLELERLDRAYWETLVLLAKPNLKVDERTEQAILAELNRLLGAYRALEGRKAELEALPRALSTEQVRAERDELAARAAAAADPETRASLEESLRLCEQRLENAAALSPAAERLEAQQEVIIQTLGSIQSTLLRLDNAHQALDPGQAGDIRRRLDTISSEARSVESAVQEVVSLGRG